MRDRISILLSERYSPSALPPQNDCHLRHCLPVIKTHTHSRARINTLNAKKKKKKRVTNIRGKTHMNLNDQ